jgi:hypothetical protein
VLTDQLLTAARTKREAFVIWARKHRDLLFAPEIFEPLFSKGTEFLGPVCKEILSEGPARDRTFLINILEEAGSETALRLLVLGMPGSEEPCDPLILHALASFRHPLALSVLREVIHRNNTRGMDLEETATALGALSRMELPESASFLGEVAGSRRMMLPLYRTPLRRLAKDALEGRR